MMYFNFSDLVTDLLFENLNISTAGGIVAACFVLALISVMYESIRFIREYLIYQSKKRCCQAPPEETSQLWPRNQTMTRRIKIQIHCSQTFLHVFQVILGYIIMLCVMTYNAWFMIAVVFALGIGYFLFGAVLPKEIDDEEPTCVTRPVRRNEDKTYASTSCSTHEGHHSDNLVTQLSTVTQ